MDPFHPIWTKVGRQILLNPRNKLTEDFLPIAKSKMAAAAAITSTYEIGHNLKSIQVRDPIFSSQREAL